MAVVILSQVPTSNTSLAGKETDINNRSELVNSVGPGGITTCRPEDVVVSRQESRNASSEEGSATTPTVTSTSTTSVEESTADNSSSNNNSHSSKEETGEIESNTVTTAGLVTANQEVTAKDTETAFIMNGFVRVFDRMAPSQCFYGSLESVNSDDLEDNQGTNRDTRRSTNPSTAAAVAGSANSSNSILNNDDGVTHVRQQSVNDNRSSLSAPNHAAAGSSSSDSLGCSSTCAGCMNGASTLLQHIHLDDELDDFMPGLCKEIKHDGKSRHTALQRLFILTDRQHQQNRMPIVCTTKFNVIEALVACLANDADVPDRRKALLILSNLAIPMENKAVMLLHPTITSKRSTLRTSIHGRPEPFPVNGISIANTNSNLHGTQDEEEEEDNLLSALLRVLHNRLGETYLAAACLFNLSFLEDAKTIILTWKCHGIPANDARSRARQNASTNVSFEMMRRAGRTCEIVPESELDTMPSNSCLIILESLLIDYTPYLILKDDESETGQPSVQGESVRWIMGALRNLVSIPTNARLVARTRIPKIAASLLNNSARDLGLWTSRDSIEDSSLMLLVHLAHAGCESALLPHLDVLRNVRLRIRGHGGIHEVRVKTLVQKVEVKEDEIRFRTKQKGKSQEAFDEEKKKEDVDSLLAKGVRLPDSSSQAI